ncbi:S-(hydroxymethyl)glutathione dehydrogenase [compost metagenome]
MIGEVRAAVAFGQLGRVSIEPVRLKSLGPTDVLVEMRAAGICHSDMSFINGERQGAEYPLVLGHEGAGVVLECGRDVTSVRPGDHVIPLGIPECGRCTACLSGKTNLCDEYFRDSGSRPFLLGDRAIRGFCDLGTFAEAIVVREMQLARIDSAAPLDVVCCLGCAGATGLGAALYTAKVESGASVVVFGLGGIGMNAVQGARLAGASKIIGVDTNPTREATARAAGVTDFVNPNEVDNLVDRLRELTGGGADYSFECVGNAKVLSDAVECTRKGWGTTVMVGVLPGEEKVSLRPRALLEGRRLMGSYLGNVRTRTEFPRLVDWFMQGRLSLDSLISHRIELNDINDGFERLANGTALRTVIHFQGV